MNMSHFNILRGHMQMYAVGDILWDKILVYLKPISKDFLQIITKSCTQLRYKYFDK